MRILLPFLFAIVGFFQAAGQNTSWSYNFGSNTASPYKSATYINTYLPGTEAGGGIASVRASSITEGPVELVSGGMAGGDGAELKITGGSTVTGAKFGLATFAGTTLSTFDCKINIASGTNGRFVIYFGNGANFTNGNGINVGQTFAALRLSPNATTVGLDWLTFTTTGVYTTAGLRQTSIAKNQVYRLRFFMNNSNAAATYTTGIGAAMVVHNLAGGSFDIWLDESKILAQADPPTGLLAQNIAINSMNLLNVVAGSSQPTLFIDDITYTNFLPNPPVEPTTIGLIENKYTNWLIGEGVNYNDARITDRFSRFITNGLNARNLSAYNLSSPGAAWNFENETDKQEYSDLVEQKLIRLAFLYKLKGPQSNANVHYNSSSLKDTIIALFNYMKAKGINGETDFDYDNFPDREEVVTSSKGVALRSSAYATAILLMKTALIEAGEFTNHLQALGKVTEFMDPNFPDFNFTYPGYNADIIRASLQQRLCYVLAQHDSSSTKLQNMIHLKNLVNNALKFAGGWNDCIKPDFITYHHRGAYANTYGSDALHQAAIINWMLSGTEYDLEPSAKSNLKQAIMTYNKFSQGFEMPRGLAGRFPFNTDPINQLRPALAYLYQADTVANVDAGREFERLWNISATANTTLQRANVISINMIHSLGGMQDMVNVLQKELTPLQERTDGHFSFPYAGLSVHKYNGGQVSVKGTSKHIWHYENGSGENIFGRYSSAGAMEILAVGNPITHASNGYTENGWDWAHTPGVTAPYLPLAEMATGTHRLFSGRNMLTHATLDSNGAFAMDYRDANAATNMSALKSNFFFKDKMICLGSNINNATGTHPIHTTLFQTALPNIESATYLNGTAVTGASFNHTQTGGTLWATDAVGNGYVIPQNGTTNNIVVQRLEQNSRNQSNTNNTSGNFATAYIDHGIAANSTPKYAYGVIMQGGAAGTQHFADNFDTYFKVWHQNSQAHVVQYLPDSIFAYAVFNPAANFTYDVVKTVNKAAVVMTQKLDEGNKLKLSLTKPLDLLSATENYNYNQLQANVALFHKTPFTDVVTLTIAGKWMPENAMNNVSVAIVGENTEISFSTINGETIQTSLIKAVLVVDQKMDILKNTDPSACTYTSQGTKFEISASGNCGEISFSYALSGATNMSDLSSLNQVVFHKGETVITCTLTDNCNIITTSFKVIVTDSEVPTITAPANLVVNTVAGLCHATGIITGHATVADNCGGKTVSNDAPTIFPIGITNITWTATDAAGNIATAIQTIEVTDVQPPTITQDSSIYRCYNEFENYTITIPTVEDNCGNYTANYSITGATTRSGNGLNASGPFNTGISVIQWTATDMHGNASTTETTVTIGSSISVSVADVFAVNPGGLANTIYLGYGPSALTLTAVASGGRMPYNYSWTNGTNTASNTVSPALAGTYNYKVTATDNLGCSSSVVKTIDVMDIRCGSDKISICHKPMVHDGNTLCNSVSAVASHLAHGCRLGNCESAGLMLEAAPVLTLLGPLSMQVMPNPTTNQFTVQLNGEINKPVQIRIISITGVLLKTMQAFPGQVIRFGSEWLPGMYLIEATQNGQKIFAKILKL